VITRVFLSLSCPWNKLKLGFRGTEFGTPKRKKRFHWHFRISAFPIHHSLIFPTIPPGRRPFLQQGSGARGRLLVPVLRRCQDTEGGSEISSVPMRKSSLCVYNNAPSFVVVYTLLRIFLGEIISNIHVTH